MTCASDNSVGTRTRSSRKRKQPTSDSNVNTISKGNISFKFRMKDFNSHESCQHKLANTNLLIPPRVSPSFPSVFTAEAHSSPKELLPSSPKVKVGTTVPVQPSPLTSTSPINSCPTSSSIENFATTRTTSITFLDSPPTTLDTFHGCTEQKELPSMLREEHFTANGSKIDLEPERLNPQLVASTTTTHSPASCTNKPSRKEKYRQNDDPTPRPSSGSVLGCEHCDSIRFLGTCYA